MRRVLFIHDHVFVRRSSVFYSEGKLTDEVFARYDVCGDEIVVICRCCDADTVDGLTPITKSNVRFAPVAGVNFGVVLGTSIINNAKLVCREVAGSDTVILRVPSFLGTFALPFVIFAKKGLFVEVVGSARDAVIQSGRGLFRHIVAHVIELATRLTVLKARGAIYVTQSALQLQYPTRGFTAAASNVEIVSRAAPRAKHEYDILGSPSIGLIGSFHNMYKGLDVAVRALAFCVDLGIRFDLRILGSGNQQPILELARALRVEEFVHFEGTLPGGDEVFQWLDRLDVYIQPSRTEGVPRALIEAMSRGLPCVGSRVGGIPEILEESDLFDSGDYVQLAERICKLLSDENERFRRGDRNLRESAKYESDVLRGTRHAFWSRASAALATSEDPNAP